MNEPRNLVAGDLLPSGDQMYYHLTTSWGFNDVPMKRSCVWLAEEASI